MFVNEAIITLEQIKGHRLETILKISDKFCAKLNVFSSVILQCFLYIRRYHKQAVRL